MNHTQLIPHLVARDAFAAIEFYKKAFGAEAPHVMKQADGSLMHAGVIIDGAMFYLADECESHGSRSPMALGGTPVTMHLQVADADALFGRAVAAGATVVMPMTDMFWGDRYGVLQDPFGHRWSLATTVKQMSMDEMMGAAKEFAAMES